MSCLCCQLFSCEILQKMSTAMLSNKVRICKTGLRKGENIKDENNVAFSSELTKGFANDVLNLIFLWFYSNFKSRFILTNHFNPFWSFQKEKASRLLFRMAFRIIGQRLKMELSTIKNAGLLTKPRIDRKCSKFLCRPTSVFISTMRSSTT